MEKYDCMWLRQKGKLNLWCTHVVPIYFLGAEHVWSYFCTINFKCTLYSMMNIHEFCFFKSHPFWGLEWGQRRENGGYTQNHFTMEITPFVVLMLHDSISFLSDFDFCLSSYKLSILISWPSTLFHSGALQALPPFADNIFIISFMITHLSWKPEILRIIN